MSEQPSAIAERVLAWFDLHGRKDLPWQHGKNHYRVWVSEIMLQQTQVASVIGYFERFMQRFPDVETLAAANVDAVLAQWSGLGYYARARNLHNAARQVVDQHNGVFPGSQDALQALPGIGRSTAAAILALVDNQPCAILDGNVKRVLARHEAIAGWPGKTAVAKQLWSAAEHYTPASRVSDYTQAMMDLGATLCTRSKPGCGRCPLRGTCRAYADNNVAAFPGKKEKKPNPQRKTGFMVLRRSDGALWLARRPDSGIWGGLYCFPEFDAAPPVPDAFSVTAEHALPAFTHKFTHFDLTISPLVIDGLWQAAAVADTQGRWVQASELAQLGVPRPVERVINSLQSSDPKQEQLL